MRHASLRTFRICIFILHFFGALSSFGPLSRPLSGGQLKLEWGGHVGRMGHPTYLTPPPPHVAQLGSQIESCQFSSYSYILKGIHIYNVRENP